MKFAGPTKKMMQALEDEGLNIRWPDTGTVKDDNTLAIEGTFYTGTAGQYEKLVTIDLRDEGDLSTKKNVDAAISNQLDEAYECFSIDDELQLNMEGTAEERLARGVPSATELLKDMQEQDSRLKRFAAVAEAVSSGRPVPKEEDERTIEIDGNTAEQIVALLEYAKDYLDPHATVDCLNVPDCMNIINELKRKLEG